MSDIETGFDPKETILNLIKQSNDDGLKGKFYRSRHYLNTIYFSDVMDVVLYHISLRPDLDNIARIKTNDFYRLVENIWREWIKYPKNETFSDLFPWNSGPGPMDGTAGPAEMYFLYYPGLQREDYLLVFFSYPEGLPSFHLHWSAYKKRHIEDMVFPKWRRKNNMKKISSVFSLSEMILERMRKERLSKSVIS